MPFGSIVDRSHRGQRKLRVNFVLSAEIVDIDGTGVLWRK